MKPLTPQTVYIPISVREEMPEENSQPFCIADDYGGNCCPVYRDNEFIDYALREEGTGRPIDCTEFVTHWLKPLSDQFVMSKNDLMNIYTAGNLRGLSEANGTTEKTVTPRDYFLKNFNFDINDKEP